jgi:hypothetical protein
MTTNDEIDAAVAVLSDLLKVGATFYPPLAVASPAISMFIAFEASKLKIGIANGTIVPDGHGGLVPNTNSRVMPDGTLRAYDPALDG